MNANAKIHHLSVSLLTKERLYECYMPFIEGGGLFIPSPRIFDMHSELNLSLILLGSADRYQLSCRVVWQTPIQAIGGRQSGVGVQLLGDEGKRVHQRIESHLAGMLDSQRATHTL